MEQHRQTGVVVGVDGSEAGGAAVRYAALEAQRHGEALTLVHVVPDFVATSPPAYLVPTDLQQDVETFGRSLLAAAAAAASTLAPRLRTTEVLRVGRTVPTMVREAGQARLVVLGHESVPPLGRLVEGAVTLGVAARAAGPVVSVPGSWSPDRSTGTVVAGLKLTEHAPELLTAAFTEAAARDARLVLFHAWALPSLYDDRILARSHREEWSRAANEDIDALLAGHRASHPGVRVEVKVVNARAVDALAEAAADADLLVLVRRARGFPAATHLGSTARALLGHASCPVLVVPPQHAEEGGEPEGAVQRGVVPAHAPSSVGGR
jgi:nucleotide-binding universal stress UspA family protein